MHNVITICYLVINAKLSHEYWLMLLSWLNQNFYHSLFSRSIFSTFSGVAIPPGFIFWSRVKVGLLCFPLRAEWRRGAQWCCVGGEQQCTASSFSLAWPRPLGSPLLGWQFWQIGVRRQTEAMAETDCSCMAPGTHSPDSVVFKDRDARSKEDDWTISKLSVSFLTMRNDISIASNRPWS